MSRTKFFTTSIEVNVLIESGNNVLRLEGLPSLSRNFMHESEDSVD